MTQNFYPVIGSAGNRMKNLFQLLNENDIETNVLTTEPAYPNKNMYKDNDFWDDEDLNKEKNRVIRIPINNNNFSNHIINRLFFYLEIMFRFLVVLWRGRKSKYDFIYVSTPPIFIVFSAFVGRLLFKNCKLILEVRDLWPDSLVGVKTFDNKLIINCFRFLEKRMYRNADFIVINSLGFKEHIESKLHGKKIPIVYLPNGPRSNEIVQSRDYHSEFRVVYTGNLGLAQDVDRLKVIAKMLNEKNIRLDVIGYGIRTEEFTNFLTVNNLSNVHVNKPTTRKKSLQLIGNSNIAIAFLNDEEVFSTVLPGKVIDYMTCKTPIIAGVKGIAAETITENNAGFVFDQDDMDGMVEQIEELKNNSELLVELGENCLQTVKKEFLWEQNIDNLLEIIR